MKVNNEDQSASGKRTISLVAIIVAAIIFAFLKLNGTNISQTLWAEDGSVFINQAHEMGISSLWTTYAGYFHLYPRLVALFSSFFDLKTTPIIFFSGWLLAYTSLVYVAANRALQYGLNPIEAGLLVILMIAQPHSGEVFFNLTNAQWFIGGALAIYVLVPNIDKSSIFEKWILSVASLTGPFSLILTFILLMQLVIYRDWKDRKYIYTIVGAGALIQVAAIFLSNRLTNGGFDHDVNHWMVAVFNFLSFGTSSTIGKGESILFWSVTAYIFSRNLDVESKHYSDSIGGIYLSLFAGAVFFFGLSLLASKANPHFLNPVGSSARYFFVPYLLIFFAVFLAASKQPKLKIIIFVILLLISISSFRFSSKEDLQYRAYVEFARIKSDVFIPIQPQWNDFPLWSIYLPDNSKHLKKTIDVIELSLAEANMLNIKGANDKYLENNFISLNDDPQVTFRIGKVCANALYLGMEIHTARPEGGWVQLFWSETEGFSENNSLRRYYPAGDAIVQFALPRKNVQYLRFDPLEQRSKFSINSVRLYCLGE